MRYIQSFVAKDLQKKMVFISGPRQCGKTTLAKSLLTQVSSEAYFNWDNAEDRKSMLKKDWNEKSKIIVFDELHKYTKWRNWIKGIYDKNNSKNQFLITGSARLETYRRGGDSLVGRYFPWRLHPLCLAECPTSINLSECFERLLQLGGFPEPFLGNDIREATRWRRVRRDLILKEDLRDLERVRDIGLLEVLLDLLASRVGGPIVISNLAEDLQVASKTVKHWIEILSRLFLIFSVPAFSGSLPRTLSKPSKIYFYDNADVKFEDASSEIGAKYENLVATHLLKRLHFLEDSTGERYELRYLRDKEGHEVDFAIIKNKKLFCLIEVKWQDQTPHSGLLYFGKKLNCKNLIQLVGRDFSSISKQGIYIAAAQRWLSRPLDTPLEAMMNNGV